MIEYPTMEQVEAAGHEQLARWSRFLSSPGMASAAKGDPGWIFRQEMDKEALIINRILERFKEFGGWNPKLSKRIGWG